LKDKSSKFSLKKVSLKIINSQQREQTPFLTMKKIFKLKIKKNNKLKKESTNIILEYEAIKIIDASCNRTFTCPMLYIFYCNMHSASNE
jgi:hypothetical protein